jgi:Glycosyl hydrolase catalytic core
MTTYDQVKRPLWVTEWNNGANWTGCGDPTAAQQQAAVAAMIDMLDNTPFVERYAAYNWVEDVRRLVWDDGSTTTAGVTQQILGDNGLTRSIRATLPKGAAGQRFVRLKVAH